MSVPTWGSCQSTDPSPQHSGSSSIGRADAGPGPACLKVQMQKRKWKQANVGETLATRREPPPLLSVPAPAATWWLCPCGFQPEDRCDLSEPPIPQAPGTGPIQAAEITTCFLNGAGNLTTKHHTQGTGRNTKSRERDCVGVNMQVCQRKV